jgi:hypothetical protein
MKVRRLVLPPTSSPRRSLRRPYDLRHLRIIWCLNSGVPAYRR